MFCCNVWQLGSSLSRFGLWSHNTHNPLARPYLSFGFSSLFLLLLVFLASWYVLSLRFPSHSTVLLCFSQLCCCLVFVSSPWLYRRFCFSNFSLAALALNFLHRFLTRTSVHLCPSFRFVKGFDLFWMFVVSQFCFASLTKRGSSKAGIHAND